MRESHIRYPKTYIIMKTAGFTKVLFRSSVDIHSHCAAADAATELRKIRARLLVTNRLTESLRWSKAPVYSVKQHGLPADQRAQIS